MPAAQQGAARLGRVAPHGSAESGLSSAEAADRLRASGPNALAVHRVSALAVLLGQVRNPLLLPLLATATVNADHADSCRAGAFRVFAVETAEDAVEITLGEPLSRIHDAVETEAVASPPPGLAGRFLTTRT